MPFSLSSTTVKVYSLQAGQGLAWLMSSIVWGGQYLNWNFYTAKCSSSPPLIQLQPVVLILECLWLKSVSVNMFYK